MSITSIFNMGTTGINMSRLGIEVTSENIANVNTKGYSRQRVNFETGPVVNFGSYSLGTGVQLADIQRFHDELLQGQIVKGNSQYGESLTKQTALDQIEPLFNEISSDGLGQTMEDFFNSWQDLSVNPQGTAERQAVISRAQIMVDEFHRLNSSLEDVRTSADTSLDGITADITEMARNLASLNNQILQTERLGGSANELRDQRDYLLQQLGTKAGINYAEESDGTVTVSLQGGEVLVQGASYGTVSTQDNTTTGLNNIMFTPIGGGASSNVTSTIGGAGNGLGEIGGTLQVRDEIVPGYLAKLNEMARQLVTSVNTTHNAGYAPDGNHYNFFDPANITSANISLVAGLTPSTIAAAGANPTTVSGVGDNANALALAKLKSTPLTFTVAGNTTSATMASYFNSVVSGVGIDAKSAKNISSQNESFLKQLNSLRESHSGVSLDEELTNLIKYQRSFQASARIITTASEMLDTVIAMVR